MFWWSFWKTIDVNGFDAFQNAGLQLEVGPRGPFRLLVYANKNHNFADSPVTKTNIQSNSWQPFQKWGHLVKIWIVLNGKFFCFSSQYQSRWTCQCYNCCLAPSWWMGTWIWMVLKQTCCNLCVFIGIKFGLKILLRVKELTFCNSHHPLHKTNLPSQIPTLSSHIPYSLTMPPSFPPAPHLLLLLTVISI